MIIRDIIITVAVLAVTVSCFFVMRRLDKLLNENARRIRVEEKEPHRTMLTTELSDGELIKEIRTYEEDHGEAKITLSHGDDEQ